MATTQLNLIQEIISTSRWVQDRITPIAGGASGVSTPLLIPGVPPVTSGGTTSGTSTATSTTAPAVSSAAGTATFVVAAPTTVAASATVTLPGAADARWLSLNETIATVDAGGLVTGPSRGTTQIVAVSAAADGSLRVTTVPITVP